MIHCRYLTAFDQPRDQLEAALYALMGDLDAVYESIRLNPLSNHFELEAIANQSFEFTLTVHWPDDGTLPTLIIFDIELVTPVEPYKLNEALALPAAAYFPPLTLVYNSFGRERSLRLFPRVLDLENALRELIIAVMLKRFGPDWWQNVIVNNQLNRAGTSTAEASLQQEAEIRLHDSLPMHPLYYIDLKALREIMEQVDELVEAQVRLTLPPPPNPSRAQRRRWEEALNSQLPFASILENYDRVPITAKISEIRELRNRLMHGRYLTEENEQEIEVICGQIHRFLVVPGHVGNFDDRILRNH
jgi:hypothetical protein